MREVVVIYYKVYFVDLLPKLFVLLKDVGWSFTTSLRARKSWFGDFGGSEGGVRVEKSFGEGWVFQECVERFNGVSVPSFVAGFELNFFSLFWVKIGDGIFAPKYVVGYGFEFFGSGGKG